MDGEATVSILKQQLTISHTIENSWRHASTRKYQPQCHAEEIQVSTTKIEVNALEEFIV